MKAYAALAVIAVVASASAPAEAHHSGAMFDRSRQVTVTGLVTEFDWTNPHASFQVAEMKPDGTTEIWGVEMNSPNNLVREGWTRNTLKAGDKVTALINPLRDGKPGGVYVGITLPDGKVLGASAAPQAKSTY